MKILFMCTGNVRRSPMAEAMFREIVRNSKYEGEIMCQSAGITPVQGEIVSANAAEVMKEIGIDISEHKARKFTKEELNVWDAFFVMSDTHAYIMAQSGIPQGKIYTVQPNIDDPRDCDLYEYRLCRDKIMREVEVFFVKLADYLEAIRAN